jgi:hypothetical protein
VNTAPSRAVMSSTYMTRRSQKARCASAIATVQCAPTGVALARHQRIVLLSYVV